MVRFVCMTYFYRTIRIWWACVLMFVRHEHRYKYSFHISMAQTVALQLVWYLCHYCAFEWIPMKIGNWIVCMCAGACVCILLIDSWSEKMRENVVKQMNEKNTWEWQPCQLRSACERKFSLSHSFVFIWESRTSAIIESIMGTSKLFIRCGDVQ